MPEKYKYFKNKITKPFIITPLGPCLSIYKYLDVEGGSYLVEKGYMTLKFEWLCKNT